MNVLIVARTKMSGTHRCIGGLADGGQSVRLLTAQGHHWDTDSPFQIGQVWEMDVRAPQAVVAPHVEDVLVTRHALLRVQPNLRIHLAGRVPAWRGGIDQLFGGVLGYTANNNAYVARRLGVPANSTGFWIPDRDLTLRADGKHYDYPQQWGMRGLSYVGESRPLPTIPAGTLVRVSLARWWSPDDVEDLEDRCYAQLSGWYL